MKTFNKHRSDKTPPAVPQSSSRSTERWVQELLRKANIEVDVRQLNVLVEGIEAKDNRVKELENCLNAYPGVNAMEFEKDKMIAWIMQVDQLLNK